MTSLQLKEYLDFKAEQYNTKQFIDTDPIQLPHRFSRKE
ncbi:MAG: TIGR02757 family protein, partial [Fluviicola sp.]|nr:TIGR02757 family protein [Fluviicola sp.]